MKQIFILVITAILLVSCGLVQKRHTTKEQGGVDSTHELGEGAENLVVPNVKNPKVGIVLTPGGARTYAFIGLLREFEKAKIPIHVVVGQEWGALMAGLYSMSGKANDVEWKAFKISEDFAKKGLLSSAVEARNFSDMKEYLKILFEDKKIENGKIPFSCITQGLANQRTLTLQKGFYKENVGFCLAYPPLLKNYNGWVSSSMQTKALIQQANLMGADYIVLVDVVTGSSPLGGTKVDESVQILWSEIVRDVQQSKKYAHHVVSIPVGQSILDFKARRTLLQQGETAGKAEAQKIIEKLGL